jgi:hypothetical protein
VRRLGIERPSVYRLWTTVTTNEGSGLCIWPEYSLSAPEGGEGRGEVGGAPRSEQCDHPPHPPAACATSPSLSPRERAERANGSQLDRLPRKCVHAVTRKRGSREPLEPCGPVRRDPQRLFPQEDTGLIQGIAEGAQNISPQAMEDRMRAILAVVTKDPAVAAANAHIG